MDEDQYRQLYREVNPNRCVFEKAINHRRCDCRHKEHFLLATREGVRCQLPEQRALCQQLLNTLREGSRFALRETLIDGPLPHNKELKVQVGGMQALQQLLDIAGDLPNINQLIETGQIRYGTIGALPYPELIRGVVHFESRRKRRGGN